jgi:hypothetical protein
MTISLSLRKPHVSRKQRKQRVKKRQKRAEFLDTILDYGIEA